MPIIFQEFRHLFLELYSSRTSYEPMVTSKLFCSFSSFCILPSSHEGKCQYNNGKGVEFNSYRLMQNLPRIALKRSIQFSTLWKRTSIFCGGSNWHMDCIFVELNFFTQNFNHPHVQNQKNFNENVYVNMLGHGRKFACLWTFFATTLSHSKRTWFKHLYLSGQRLHGPKYQHHRDNAFKRDWTYELSSFLVILNPIVINKMKRWAIWPPYGSL